MQTPAGARRGDPAEPGVAPTGVAPDGADAVMAFPRIARLELDELLSQLIDRAQDVLSTQGRLQGLLAATRAISAALSLPVLLHRITQAACDLVGARYGALGVIGPDAQLVEFVTVGMDQEMADRIGTLPHGAGLLGLLISDPRPLRVRDLGEHPRSAGFPEAHPPMRSFLGVPIRVRDRVFGNLYLTEKSQGGPDGAQFTADDEELLGALASAAGVAIDNARLYESTQRRHAWMVAAADTVNGLLSEQAEALPMIAARARACADADLAVVLIPHPESADTLLVVAVDGTADGQLAGQSVPAPTSLAGVALIEDRDLLVDEGEAAAAGPVCVGAMVGPTLLIRVPGAAGGEDRPGVLALVRGHGKPPFQVEDREMSVAFAGQAGLALQLAGAQQARRRMLLAEDRDRIARDLHDHVIQRLFGTGLAMSALAARTNDPVAAEGLERFTEDLDTTIRTIRQAIFQLQPPAPQRPGLRSLVLGIVDELTPLLGVAPQLRLEGAMDTLVGPTVGGHAGAVLREALTNVARHAHASTVDVTVRVTASLLAVTVTDDGTGLQESSRRSGLANLAARAEDLGGSFRVESPTTSDGRGTRLHWQVPTDEF